MDELSRKKLTTIIEKDGGKNWWVPEAFEKHIRVNLPRELHVVTAPPSHAQNYNCFVFVFGLQNEPEFLGGKNPIQKEFIGHLLEQHILTVTPLPVSGDLIFYEDDTKSITHGGIMQSPTTVISKWMWGPTIVHNIWDVPSSFGEKVFFCKPVTSDRIKEIYKDYKKSGAIIQPIE